MGIFDKRVAFKPFEYPDVIPFMDAIDNSFWTVREWNFSADSHDFRTRLSHKERSAIKNALLAISQIEISVKLFWAKLGERFPKAEFSNVGLVFAASEVRHANAYSHLLEVLGLNDDFAMLLDSPVIKGRVDYLSKYLKGAANNSNQNYTLTLTLFSIFIENVSLFSQFLVIKSFNKCRNMLKDVDNVVQATLKEEICHTLLGVRLIEHIKTEYPEWFDESFYTKIERACKKAFEAERGIIDWIFEEGDLTFLSKDEVVEFTKRRFNESLVLIGASPVFDVNEESLVRLQWFEEEIHSDVNTDFFHKKPVTYAKGMSAVNAEDIF